MKKIILLITFILATLLIISCSHEHTGGERCNAPSVCETCGKQYGEPSGHLMGYATDATTHTYKCLRPNCSEVGTRAAHFGGTATCAEKATCVECGEHYGKTLAHTLSAATCTERGKCTVCGAEDGKLIPHDYSNATCQTAGTCSMCGKTNGQTAPHSYVGASCTELGVCTMCGTSGGSLLAHYYEGETCAELGKCVECGTSGGEYSEDHTIAANADFCSVCNMDYFSATLKFKKSATGDYYTVTGIGKCTRADVIVPAEYRGLPVLQIGSSAFAGTTISSIVIPEGVMDIAAAAFGSCANLTSVTIPSTVTSIGSQAFSASAISSITLPTRLRTLGDQAFTYCANLTEITIPENITELKGTFNGCSSLTSVTLSRNFKTIGDYTFAETAIKNFVVPNTVETIGALAFSQSKLETITFGTGLTSVGTAAFSSSMLKSVVLPDSLTEIADSMFSGCVALTSVTLGNAVETILSNAFMGCPALRNITIPSTVKSVGETVFEDCLSLEYNVYEGVNYLGNADAPHYLLVGTTVEIVNMPDDTVIIPSGALKNSIVKEIMIGKGVTILGENLFYDTDYLVKITVHPENGLYTAVNNCLIEKATKKLIRGCATSVIPEDGSVLEMASNAFSNIANLKVLRIPAILKSVSLEILYCDNLKYIIIAKGVESIYVSYVESNGEFDVLYEGTEAEWQNVVIEGGYYMNILTGEPIPGQFIKANKYFYAENEPTAKGSYWRYVDGVVTKWD